MVRHTAALEVLRRCKVVRQTMQTKTKCRRNLGRIARHLRPLDIDMDGCVKKCVFTVRSLDRLHDAALTRFLHKKTEGIVYHPPLYSRANRERFHGFELNVIREAEFTEHHRERANASLPKLCVGKRMRYLNSRICKDPRLLHERPLRICESRTTATNAPLRVAHYRNFLDDPNITEGICTHETR